MAESILNTHLPFLPLLLQLITAYGCNSASKISLSLHPTLVLSGLEGNSSPPPAEPTLKVTIKHHLP